MRITKELREKLFRAGSEEEVRAMPGKDAEKQKRFHTEIRKENPMEITKELKEKLLKANSEEEVKAILGDEATQEEAAFVWEKVQAKKAEVLEAVDDEELEAVSGGALWCLFGGEYAADGKEVGCWEFNYKDWNQANEKICKNGNADIGWYHDWDEGEEFLSGKRYYVRRRCKKCNEIKTTPTGWSTL